ncbi:MAG: hypothetical protein H5T68_08575 [Chloroflexi bacterium]|nr:hypothetical protein [Chloroflexota bacterium]
MAIKAATDITEAIRVCRPDEPLEPGDSRYQDFSQIRGMALDKRIGRRLESYTSGGEYAYIALAGHRGCGKSTELYCVKKWAEAQGYLTIYTRVDQELDPFDVDYPDLLLLVARLIESEFRARNWPLDAKTLEYIRNWFKEVTNIQDKELEASIGVSGQVGAEIPIFAKLMIALTSGIRAGGKSKTEIRETVQRYPKALVDNINLLLDTAYATLREKKQRGLLLIFDNMDRYQPEIADQLLLKSADILRGIHCHVIYTVPISLIYAPIGDSVRERFALEILPMIKVRKRNGDDCEEGIDAMTQALQKRLDVETLFEDKTLARELAKMSGGCIRDLMHLTQEALLVSDQQVSRQAVERAAQTVRSQFSREIGINQYSLLARVHLNKTVANDAEHRQLLFRRDVLEYNYTEDRWADVHPLVLGIREFQDALKEEKRKLGLSSPSP